MITNGNDSLNSRFAVGFADSLALVHVTKESTRGAFITS